MPEPDWPYWCADAWDGAPLTARSFGHPQGMCYVGRAGAFLYLPVPKVATTVGRQWAAAAYGEEAGAPAPWLIPAAAKPPADRLDGATLYRLLPGAVKRSAAAFAFVRDPLSRYASGWRELRAYERGPPARRGWGKVALRQRGFYANASDVAAVAALFGANERGPRRRPPAASPEDLALRDGVLAAAARDLACDADWNEHLTPQTAFFPAGFSGVVAPAESMDAVLPAAAAAANLSAATARRFVAAAPDDERRRPANANARDGWPQPEDLKTAFVHADRGSLDPPTTHVWCWTHARDYATFAAFYAPPPWCAAAWRALGFGSAEGVFSS